MVESKKQWKAWLYLSPAIVLLLVFTVWPIINTVRMAFLEGYSGLQAVGGATFKFGLGNFIKVVEYKKFIQCLKNTIILCFATVPISTLLALLIATPFWIVNGIRDRKGKENGDTKTPSHSDSSSQQGDDLPEDTTPAVNADTVLLGSEIQSEYAVLLDMTDGRVVAAKNAAVQANPASITKVMTLLVAVENI